MNQDYLSAIAWTRREDGIFEHMIGEEWFQGRGAFGGLLAAAILKGMEEVVDSEAHQVRSMNLQFCGALVAEPSTMEVEITRRGSSVIAARATIKQGEEIKTTAAALFAKSRDDRWDFDQSQAPEVPPPQEAPTVPWSPLFPKFAIYYEYKFCVGQIPFSGHEEGHVGGWCRLKDSPEPADAGQIAALLDIWPPAMLTRVAKPTAAATISWQLIFHHPLPLFEAAADDYYLVDARSTHTRSGYASEQASLFTEEGQLLAESTQVVTIFG